MNSPESNLKEVLASMSRYLESYKEALGALLSVLESVSSVPSADTLSDQDNQEQDDHKADA